MNNISIVAAIIAVRRAQDGGDAQVSVSGEDFNRMVWHDGNPTNITNQQITDKQAELQIEYDGNQYQRDRRFKYPSLKDQLDDIYHNGIDGWKTTIKAIKDADPKP